MLTTILLYALLAIIALEVFNYFIFYSKLAFGKNNIQKQTDRMQKPVSLIVYIKDQEDILPQYLPTLLNQDHPTYQIILVNNASCDDSLEILEAFEKTHPRIKLVNVVNNEAFWNNKKYALTLGIKVAKHDYLVFTEPSAQLLNTNWLSSMANYFTPKKQVVIGYTSIVKKKRSFINKLFRYHNTFAFSKLFTGTQLMGPLHGNTLNQGYLKDLFYANNGFIQQMKIPFGEKYSFIQQIASSKNTTIAINSSSFVYQEEDNKLSTFIKEVKMQGLQLKASSFKFRLVRSFSAILPLSFYILFIILVSINPLLEVLWIGFGLRMLVKFIYDYQLFKKFATKDLIWVLPLLEFIHIFILSYLAITQFITGKKLEKNNS
ncbi:glycosyltransferase [Myroides sp. LJL116]